MFRPKCTTLLPCRFWGGVLDANATSFLGSAKPPTTHSQSAHPSVSRLKLRAHNQLNWPTFVSPIFSDMSNAMSNPSVKPAKGTVTEAKRRWQANKAPVAPSQTASFARFSGFSNFQWIASLHRPPRVPSSGGRHKLGPKLSKTGRLRAAIYGFMDLWIYHPDSW